MIYASHNFTENFLAAVGSEDKPMKLHIISDEIARLIVDDKTSIVKIMRKHGINATYSDNNLRIANLLSKSLETNKELKKEIASIIAKKNVDQNSSMSAFTSFSVDGKEDKAGSTTNTLAQKLKDAVANNILVESITDIIDDSINSVFTRTTGENQSEAADLLAERIRMNEMTSGFATIDAIRKKRRKIIKATVIVLGSAALIFLAYKGYKKYKSKLDSGASSLASSGDANLDNPTGDTGKIVIGNTPPTPPTI